MSLTEIFLIAVSLSMDAFSVAVCKGLAIKRNSYKEAIIVGLWFGGFQALMPAIGYFLGSTFAEHIKSIDHWVAFALLGIIGVNMIREATGCSCERMGDSLSFGEMLTMAVATSIDALAVGVTFSFEFAGSSLVLGAVVLIGVTTFVISALGVKIGNVFGVKFKSKAELFGGVILVVLGIKILAEGLLG